LLRHERFWEILEEGKIYLVKTLKGLKKKGNIFSPIRDQIRHLINYIDVLERKQGKITVDDLSSLIDYIEIKKKYCEIYIRYITIQTGKQNHD